MGWNPIKDVKKLAKKVGDEVERIPKNIKKGYESAEDNVKAELSRFDDRVLQGAGDWVDEKWEDYGGYITTAIGGMMTATGFLAPIGMGMMYGGLLSGATSYAMTGEFDNEMMSKAMFEGAVAGAATAGAGVVGSSVGKSAATFAQGAGAGVKLAGAAGKVAAFGAGAAGGYGAGKLLGKEDMGALAMGAGAGYLGYANFSANWSNYQEWEAFKNNLIADQKYAGIDVKSLIEPYNALNSVSMASTINSIGGLLAVGGGGAAGSLQPPPVGDGGGSQVIQNQMASTGLTSDPLYKSRPVTDPGDETAGFGWGRDQGSLFGGVDTLKASLPSRRRDDQFALSDEMLLKTGAAI